MKTIEEIQAMLNEDLDMALTEQRKGAGSMKLDYMSTFGTKDGLNKVFGNGCWGYDLIEGQFGEIEDCRESYEDRYKKLKHTRGYKAMVKVYATYIDHGKVVQISCTDVGFGDCSDASKLKAHETAGKEAVTDGIKRAANGFGYRLGLALYDKQRRNVTTGKPAAKKAAPKAAAKPASKPKAVAKKGDSKEAAALAKKMSVAKDLESLNKLRDEARSYCEKNPEAVQSLQQAFQKRKEEL